MQYRVIIVSPQKSCCSSTFINDEVEKACNSMADQGYVLVNFWESRVTDCGGSTHAICLIFVRP